MRVLRLPRVAELRDGLFVALWDEDRVVAEAAAAARAVGDRPLEDAGPAQLVAVRGDRDELADVPRAPVLDARQLAEQLRDRRRAFRRVARGVDARTAAERRHLDSRVFADRPAADTPVTEAGFRHGVLVIRRAGLRRIV